MLEVAQQGIAEVKPGIRQVVAQLEGLTPEGDRLRFTALIHPNRGEIGVCHRVGRAVDHELFVDRFSLSNPAG